MPIYIGLGANLPSFAGAPADTLQAALGALENAGVRVVCRSRLYRSPAHPPSDQPDFTNAVAEVSTALTPAELLALLHTIEAQFGRRRGAANAARTLDLDLLDYHGAWAAGPDGPLLPHPRLRERPFVLLPLAEVAPHWRDPQTQQTIEELIAGLPPHPEVQLEDAPGP
jgi:2-amino-4-hydroxy-6-hydroxymethyldihydropteridine diphosphokinase